MCSSSSGCSCCCCTGPPTGGDGDGGGTQPCRKYRLTIDSISVTAIDDGWFGGNLEVDFTFTVNGQAQHYVNNDLGTGVTNIGVTFFVDVPTDTSTISLAVAGIEKDEFFDDILAGFTALYGQAQNWGLGFQTGSASDSNITYTLNYTITCATSRNVAVSRQLLLAYGRAKAEQRHADRVSETDMEAWALARLGRDSWEVVEVMGDRYMMRGYGNLPRLLEQRFQG